MVRQHSLRNPRRAPRSLPTALRRVGIRPVLMPLAIFSLISSSFVAIAPTQVRAAGDYTIFAGTTSCPSDSKQFDWEGSNSAVTGSIHSNAGIFVSGNNHTTSGTATYAAACGASVSGTGNLFGTDATPSPAAIQTMPEYPIPTCAPEKTFTGDKNLTEEAVDGQLSGAYCVTGGKLDLSGPVSGTVTLYSDREIVISGGGVDLEPLPTGILLHSTLAGPDAITVSSSNSSLLGIIFARYGEAEISGQNVVAGCIAGDTVKLHGSDHVFVGCGGVSNEPPGGGNDPNNTPGGGNDPNNTPGGGNDPNNTPGAGDDPSNNPGGTGSPNSPGGSDNSTNPGGSGSPNTPGGNTSQPTGSNPAGAGGDSNQATLGPSAQGQPGAIPNTSMASSTSGWLTAVGLFLVAMALSLRPRLGSSRA
jgi:hypothetical protein